MTDMKKIAVHNPSGLPTINFSELLEFQAYFKKEISLENLEKLKRSILQNGIFIPKFVWFHKDKPYILDGHQTRAALESLSREGFEIPPIPYVLIYAQTMEEAKSKLLVLNSRFSDINPDSEWLKGLDDLSYLFETIRIPELNEVFKNVQVNDAPLSPKIKPLSKPFKKIHILLSIPAENYHEIIDILDQVQKNQNIEVVQGAN